MTQPSRADAGSLLDKIQFRQTGPSDPVVRYLTSELDAELDVMYPPEEGLRTPPSDEPRGPRTHRRDISSRPEKETGSSEELSSSADLIYLVACVENSPSATAISSEKESIDTTLGCIAFRPLPDYLFPDSPGRRFAELTRMYVRPSARGSGLSRKLVDEVEKLARESYGLDVLTLRTGYRQVPAIRMYEKAGYRQRALYGDYIGRGVEDGGVSVCYEKALAQG